MKRIQPELIPILIAAFLAPVIGGHVSLDALPFEQGVFSSDTPLLSRAILGTLVAIGLAIALIRHKVVQIPKLTVCALVVSLVALVGLSILSSAFPYISYGAWVTWIVYGMCLFAVVAASGRRIGVRALLWSMVAGGTITALKGISEYAAVRASEPGHRIFADWVNPNATAGIFCVLIPLGLGLTMSSERLEAIGSGLCSALMLFALALTQSKGGLLSTGVAVAVVTCAAIAWNGRGRAIRPIASVAAAGLLIFGATLASKSQSGASPLDRVVNAGTSREQSAGFRSLLWRGAVQMIKAKPTGYGVGTYRFESARPGLTEQTFHTHQTWLQLAVETGPLALLTMVGLAAFWVVTLLTGAKKWPWPDAGLRAGILASCVAGAANGFMESNLIYLGIGMTLFFVIGAGLQCSSDGTIPEYSPKNLRWALVGVVCVFPCLLLWHTAVVELAKSTALAKLQGGDGPGAKSDLDFALSMAPVDGEALYLASAFAQSENEHTSILARASKFNPSTKYLRAYSKSALKSGRLIEADRALEQALSKDPNNLQTLELLYKNAIQNHKVSKAVELAKKLVAVENTVYFRTRAIPELVPLETYDARVFLADQSKNTEDRINLLKPAIEGYANYFVQTAPMIERLTSGDPQRTFLGHDMKEIEEVAIRAKAAAKTLRRLYGESNNISSIAWLDEISRAFTVD